MHARGSAFDEAAADIREFLVPLGLTKYTEKLTKALINNWQKTWTVALEGLTHWREGDRDGYSKRRDGSGKTDSAEKHGNAAAPSLTLSRLPRRAPGLIEMGLSVGQLGEVDRALSEYNAARAPPPPPPEKVVARVRCGEVELKLTLTAKFLARSLSDALISPFLRAFDKKVGCQTAVDLSLIHI